jgi:UDP-N-acetylglucosamine 4,6-dehydratase
VAPECEHRVVGIRPGEKLHEVMIPEDDARRTLEFERYFAILPDLDPRHTAAHPDGRPCPEGFRYGSDNNSEWLTVDGLRTMLKDLEIEPA